MRRGWRAWCKRGLREGYAISASSDALRQSAVLKAGRNRVVLLLFSIVNLL